MLKSSKLTNGSMDNVILGTSSLGPFGAEMVVEYISIFLMQIDAFGRTNKEYLYWAHNGSS